MSELAEEMCRTNDAGVGPQPGEEFPCRACAHEAEVVLASGWLAAHDERVRAEERDRLTTHAFTLGIEFPKADLAPMIARIDRIAADMAAAERGGGPRVNRVNIDPEVVDVSTQDAQQVDASDAD